MERKRHHGFLIPLFSLWSKKSAGIGEFTDLAPLFPWMKKIGCDVLQLLPLNDTGEEASPYSVFSSFALHPRYIGLASLHDAESTPFLKDGLKELQGLTKTPLAETLPLILKKKELWLKEYIRLKKPLLKKGVEAFQIGQPWARDYAKAKAQNALDKEEEEFFQIALQVIAFSQLFEVRKKAEEAGIILFGDLPILISENSVDAKTHPELFDFSLRAGAPPDQYSSNGQNWGFPIYAWDKEEKAILHFWKRRLDVASIFYHWFRIDHIAGFFRIYAIPEGKKGGKEGFYIPESLPLALYQGSRRLFYLTMSTDMQAIGEDLGTVPSEMRHELDLLGIPGIKVIRWERDWKGNKEYLPVDTYPALSLTCASTHDSELLREWWESFPEDAAIYAKQKGWPYQVPLSRDYLKEILKDSHSSESLIHINLLQEYLNLAPGFSPENPKDERINEPGIISNKNWTKRFIPSLEEIIESKELEREIQSLIF